MLTDIPLADLPRRARQLEVSGRVFVVTGEAHAAWVRRRIAFYASTPAYRPVLDAHGWGDLQPKLNTLSKAGRWDDMAACVTAEMLDAFAVTGEPGEIAHLVRRRWGKVLDRVCLTPAPDDPDAWRALVGAFS